MIRLGVVVFITLNSLHSDQHRCWWCQIYPYCFAPGNHFRTANMVNITEKIKEYGYDSGKVFPNSLTLGSGSRPRWLVLKVGDSTSRMISWTGADESQKIKPQVCARQSSAAFVNSDLFRIPSWSFKRVRKRHGSYNHLWSYFACLWKALPLS